MNEEKLKLLASLKLSLQIACMQFDAIQASLEEEEMKVFSDSYNKICANVNDSEKISD